MFRLASFIPQNQIQCDNRRALCVTWTMTNMWMFESRAKTNVRNGSCFLLNLVALNYSKVRRREKRTAEPKCNKCICLWFSSLLALGTTSTTQKRPTEKKPFKRYQLTQVTFLMGFFLMWVHCLPICMENEWMFKMHSRIFSTSTFYFTYFCGIQTKTACKKSLLFE